MGGFEGSLPGESEPSLRDHSGRARILIVIFESRHLTVSGGQFIWGGCLLKGNGGVQRFPQSGRKSDLKSVKAKGSLTARPTSRAGAKAGLSDPTVPRGRAVAQRIKVTLG